MGHPQVEAHAAEPKKRARRKLDRMEIKKAKNGGHVITHHYDNSGMGQYRQPDEYAFNSGEEAMAHVSKHMGMEADEPEPKQAAAAPPKENLKEARSA